MSNKVGEENKIFTVDLNYNKHAAVDVRVENLSYVVSDRPLTIWQKLLAMEMPWEWMEERQLKMVLREISFSVKSGKMLAIMGSSGSGKTSLLDVMACRHTSGEITGEVFLNETARTRGMVDHYSAYVRQDDRLLPNLTVEETLMFVAQLKLPTTMRKAELVERVHGVMAELGLSHVAHTRVGNSEIRGVSGGERRRISIGIQLLVDPSILFLDEPTSGLDSFTAHHLVETLEKLARNNRTVLLSIHQPRSDIFNLFDLVLMLSRGEMVYFGDANKMVDYFTNLGFPCPELTNPCDHYMDLATVDTTSIGAERRSAEISSSLIAAYIRHVESLPGESIAPNIQHSSTNFQPLDASFKSRQHDPGVFRQFCVLFRHQQNFLEFYFARKALHAPISITDCFCVRSFSLHSQVQHANTHSRSTRNLIEDYSLLSIQLLQALCMSLILGFVFYDLNLDQLSMRDHFGLMYLITVMYPYMIVLDVIGQCQKEKNFLYFELQDKLYTVGAYCWAKVLSELIFHTIYITVYTIPMYFLANMQMDVAIFFKVFGLIFITVYSSRSLAMFSAALMPTFQIAGFFAQTFFSMFIMSAGFFINLDNILTWLSWVPTVSYLRWGFEGLCLVTVTPLNFTCDPPFPPQFCVYTGKEALAVYAFRDEEVWEAVVGVVSSILVFMVCYFVSMKIVPQKPHEH